MTAVGARTFADDADGARFGLAIYDQPRMLELDLDLGSTGLDYGDAKKRGRQPGVA